MHSSSRNGTQRYVTPWTLRLLSGAKKQTGIRYPWSKCGKWKRIEIGGCTSPEFLFLAHIIGVVGWFWRILQRELGVHESFPALGDCSYL